MKEKTYLYRTERKPIWCPGCGDFGILTAVIRAFENLEIPNHKIGVFSGIGCSARIAGYLNTFGFNLLHGRAIPAAEGAKLANPSLTVLAIGGDGDLFSIGAGHMPHAVRSNCDITVICVNNFVYGLTKGQTSPTTPLLDSDVGQNGYAPVDPVFAVTAYSISTRKSFIAQGISTDVAHLTNLILEGIKHRGFSFISVLTLCATYRKEMFEKIKASCVYLDQSHDPSDINAALRLAETPVAANPHLGIFFKGEEK